MSLNSLVDSRDVRFTLFELLELEKLNRFEIFKDFDRSIYEDTLELAEKIAVEVFYPSNSDGDKIGLTYDPQNYSVTVPESFHKGFQSYMEACFHTLAFSQDEGGLGLPTSISMACSEYFNAGNTALTMYCGSVTGETDVPAQDV